MSFGGHVAVVAATVALLAGAGPAVSSDRASAEGLQLATGAGHVAVIRRTQFGIPHILARNYSDLGFGYGYAFAQDNMCELADEVLTLSGQRSAFLGPDADSGDQLSGPVTNLDSDTYYRSVNASGAVERAMSQRAPLGPTPQVRELIEGYVAGVNRYLSATGVAHLPDPTCRAKPWVRPITGMDIARLIYDLDQLEGTTSVKPLIAEASPATSAVTAAPRIARSQAGSNAIALGRAGTRDRHGELLANPHFPWLGTTRFYQVQLTIPGELNVSGASIYGSPVVEIGFTSGLAWTHTVSTAQRFTLYQLRLVPGDPTSYLVDGHVEKMTAQTVRVPVLTSSGNLTTVTRTLYSSRYGPLLATGWTTTSALAMRGANAGNVRSVDEWLAMDRSESVAQLRAAQNRYQGLPFVNTVATDSRGTAYFADASVVPHVTDAEAARCVDSPLGQAVYPAETILDGSETSCAWGTDPRAILPGIFAPATDPTLTRADFVTNSNDSAWLTNPAAPLTGYPRIYGDVGTPRSLRTRLGLDMIAGRLSGRDGLGSPGFSVSTLQRDELNDRDLSGELGRDALLDWCRTHRAVEADDGNIVDVAAACHALAGWNLKGDPDSRGAVLWRVFWLDVLAVPDLWSVPFDPAHPATTPRGLDTAAPDVTRAFGYAVERLAAVGVPPDAPLSAAQLTTIGGPAVAVPGCLAEEGCYNVVTNPGPETLGGDGRFPAVTFGSSFIMAADLGPSGPRVRSVLTYSESANPASPHHNDQTLLFARKQWVTDEFTEARIAADPQLRVTVVTDHQAGYRR